MQRDPLNGEAQITLGDFYRDKDDYENAKFAYVAASKVDDHQWKALIALARLEVKERNYSQALAFLRRAQALDDRPFLTDYINQLEKALGKS